MSESYCRRIPKPKEVWQCETCNFQDEDYKVVLAHEKTCQRKKSHCSYSVNCGKDKNETRKIWKCFTTMQIEMQKGLKNV